MIPPAVSELVDLLAGMEGVVAVVLGGSRATGAARPDSDWDLGVYYRERIDLDRLRERGEVHPPGSWGRIMNGGAWLAVPGVPVKVDVLLRDLDVVDLWTARAVRGEYEVDALLGYVAGVPTYSLAAERASARVLRGALPPPVAFPDALAETGHARWQFHARFTSSYARGLAARGDVVGARGQAAKAVIEAAHARLCAERSWVLNEKRILDRAGMQDLQRLFGEPTTPEHVSTWLDKVIAALEAAAIGRGAKDPLASR